MSTEASITAPSGITQTLKAVAWMMGALASFTTMALSARELSAEITVVQMSLLRSLFCIAVLLPMAFWYGTRSVATRKPGMHLLRNTIHFGGQFGWMYGITILPLAAVFSLEFTVPIWTAILAAIFLRERLTTYRLIGVGMGFAGILTILRPGSELLDLASFAVIGAAICYASTYVFTRGMRSTESPFCIIFWMNIVQFPIGLGLTVWAGWTTPSPALWPWVIAIGCAGLASHYCVAQAMRLADATVVAPLDFVRLPLIAVVGYLLYSEPWNPWVLIGGTVIFAGNLAIVLGERRR